MSTKPKIEDAGEKLWGARKDMVSSSLGGEGQGVEGGQLEIASEPQYACLLDKLWPKPERWADLIPQIGGIRAALAMVLREGLAKDPHPDGRHGFTAAQWKDAYEFAIGVLRGLVETPGTVDFDAMSDAYNEQVSTFAHRIDQPPRSKTMWSYAISRLGTRTTKHPFSMTPIDGLRWKYLHEWGWGQDPLVGDRLSMGALELTYQKTGKKVWQAVTGKPGKWWTLENTEFGTEREAIECARTYVDKLLQEKQQELDAKEAEKAAARARKQGTTGSDGETSSNPSPMPTSPMGWKRPMALNVHQRTGFDRPAATDKTELDLIATFGFRGIEFGNWVTQGERRDFVNATYDALLDMTELLRMPPRFASLDGLLGLGYGSRGKGLSKIIAHFEPGNWVLHLTKDNGPGALAHEFWHAVDAWVARSLWGSVREKFMLQQAAEDAMPGKKPRHVAFDQQCRNELAPEMASEQKMWGEYADMAGNDAICLAMEKWGAQVSTHDNANDTNAMKFLGRPAWRWIQISKSMDVGRKPYWGTRPEMFARAFEVLIHDSLALKGRTNHMLVHGVSLQDGLDAVAAGGLSPYPMGEERAAMCRELAGVVRAIKSEYLCR